MKPELLAQPITKRRYLYAQTYLERRETNADSKSAGRLNKLRTLRDFIVARSEEADTDDHFAQRRYLLRECATRWWLAHADDQYLLHTQRCRLRECPICQAAKQAKWFLRIEAALTSWTAPKHIVLTLRRSDAPLHSEVRRLFQSWRRFRQHKFWQRLKPFGIAVLEVKYHPSDGSWHPHLHIVGNLPFLPFNDLKAHWQEATGDSSHVWIEPVHGNLAKYLSHYMTKGVEAYLTYPDPVALALQLKGVRTVNAFGTWPVSHRLPDRKYQRMESLYELLRAAMLGDLRAVVLVKALVPRYPTAFLETLPQFAHEAELD